MVYAVAGTLLLMLATAFMSLYLNHRNEAPSHGALFWLKIILSVPVIFFGAGLTAYLASAFGVLFLTGSSTSLDVKFLLLALAPVAVYVITVWVLFRWMRNRRNANIAVIFTIITFIGFLYLFHGPSLRW